jgi:hypothetical protein
LNTSTSSLAKNINKNKIKEQKENTGQKYGKNKKISILAALICSLKLPDLDTNFVHPIL